MNKATRRFTTGLLAALIAVPAWAGSTPVATVAQATPAQPATPAPPAEPQSDDAKTKVKVKPKVATSRNVFVRGTSGGTYLGVDTQEVTAERKTALKLPEERGVEITMVDQDAPAGKAGLKEHDVIVDYNGTRVESQEQLRRLIRETPAGRTVTLGIIRDGAPTSVQATIANRKAMTWTHRVPSPDIHIEMPEPPEMPDFPAFYAVGTSTAKLGVVVETLTPQLGEFFGVKDGEGVLVRSVEKGSAAEKGGIKAGDVIVRIGAEKVENRSDLRRALRQADAAGNLNVTVMRDKREVVVGVVLPKTKERGSFVGPEFDFDFDFDFDGWDGEWDRVEFEKLMKEMEPRIRDTQRRVARMQARLTDDQVRAIERNAQRTARDAERRADMVRKQVEEAMKKLRYD